MPEIPHRIFLLTLYVQISQCTATHYTATHCNTLQHTATHSNTVTLSNTLHRNIQGLHTRAQSKIPHALFQQHNAPHCNTLLQTATHCNALQHTATQQYRTRLAPLILQHTIPYCNTHCNTHCNTLRHRNSDQVSQPLCMFGKPVQCLWLICAKCPALSGREWVARHPTPTPTSTPTH